MSETRCRLVSFLGTGQFDAEIKANRYRPTKYGWGQKLSKETEWIIQGFSECFPLPPDEIIVLATPTAREKILERLKTAGQSPTFPDFRMIEFPEGGDDHVVWRQFSCLKNNLRVENDTNVVLDITHGFRSQPFFAAAVIAFIRAIDEPRRKIQVVYGAYEAKDEGSNVTPIWDLTPFVDLLDWTRELMLFLKTGRAKGTEKLIGSAPEFAALAKSIGRFGADLETMRTGALLLGSGDEKSAAGDLQGELDAAKGHVEDRFPPFADVLEQVRGMIDPMVINPQPLNTPEAHGALANLAKLYLSMGRYVEAATTAQEGWVSLYADDAAATPGNERCDASPRKEAAEVWRASEKKYPHKASKIRNDIDHAGYRPLPMTRDKVIEDVTSLVENFASATRKPRRRA
jgi:CRISPR-associated protein Csx16